MAAVAFGLLFLPFKDHPWSLYVAVAGSYSVLVFGLAFGSAFEDADDFFGNSQVPRYIAKLLIPHALILALIALGVSRWLYLRPTLPSWVTQEGRRGSFWDLCGWLSLGIAGVWQGLWMAGRIKRRFEGPEDRA